MYIIGFYNYSLEDDWGRYEYDQEAVKRSVMSLTLNAVFSIHTIVLVLLGAPSSAPPTWPSRHKTHGAAPHTAPRDQRRRQKPYSCDWWTSAAASAWPGRVHAAPPYLRSGEKTRPNRSSLGRVGWRSSTRRRGRRIRRGKRRKIEKGKKETRQMTYFLTFWWEGEREVMSCLSCGCSRVALPPRQCVYVLCCPDSWRGHWRRWK